jgi:hypothetical protein
MKLEFAVAAVPDLGGGGALPLTGASVTGAVLFGLVSLLAGAVLYLAGLPYRRRVGTAVPPPTVATSGP